MHCIRFSPLTIPASVEYVSAGFAPAAIVEFHATFICFYLILIIQFPALCGYIVDCNLPA